MLNYSRKKQRLLYLQREFKVRLMKSEGETVVFHKHRHFFFSLNFISWHVKITDRIFSESYCTIHSNTTQQKYWHKQYDRNDSKERHHYVINMLQGYKGFKKISEKLKSQKKN